MKLDERFIYDGSDNKIVHKRTFDAEPSINEVNAIRAQGFDKKHADGMSESYHVARIPMWLIAKIIKESGLKWDDPAFKDVVMRALQSGEYDKFRVWGGNLGRESNKRVVVGPS